MSDTPQHIAAELRRLSRKCGPDAGDVPATMVAGACVIEQMAEDLAQMTRERDEALESLGAYQIGVKHLHEELDTLTKERDALRNSAEELIRDARRWREMERRMTHQQRADALDQQRADALGWTLDDLLPGNDPGEAIDAAIAQEGNP